MPKTLVVCSFVKEMVVTCITGVAVGSGWQAWVAYINLFCYYIIGLPLGIVMGWVADLGVTVRFALSSISMNNLVIVCFDSIIICTSNKLFEPQFTTLSHYIWLLKFHIKIGHMGWDDPWRNCCPNSDFGHRDITT